MLSNPNAAVDTVYHSDWGRIVATLIRFFGDFDIAEEAAQDAFAAAVDQWRTDGVPEFPRASSRQQGTKQSTASGARTGSRRSLKHNDTARSTECSRLRNFCGNIGI